MPHSDRAVLSCKGDLEQIECRSGDQLHRALGAGAGCYREGLIAGALKGALEIKPDRRIQWTALGQLESREQCSLGLAILFVHDQVRKLGFCSVILRTHGWVDPRAQITRKWQWRNRSRPQGRRTTGWRGAGYTGRGARSYRCGLLGHDAARSIGERSVIARPLHSYLFGLLRGLLQTSRHSVVMLDQLGARLFHAGAGQLHCIPPLLRVVDSGAQCRERRAFPFQRKLQLLDVAVRVIGNGIDAGADRGTLRRRLTGRAPVELRRSRLSLDGGRFLFDVVPQGLQIGFLQ